MPSVEFFVAGKPEPKGSMSAYVIRGTNRAVVTDGNKALKPWAAKIRLLASNQIVEAEADVPVVVRFEFLLDRPASVKVSKRPDHVIRPDLDKLIRGAMDALTGVLFHDDSQVVKIEAHKRYALHGEAAGVLISVQPFVTDYPQG
jgi:Holliday junction resolvase RusA-like endonuclease